MTAPINIFDEIRFDAKSRNRSVEWYLGKVKEMKSRGLVTKNKLYTYDDMVTNKLEIGSMYLYIYDPKFKKTLPIYDTFPLCLPFAIDGGNPHTKTEPNFTGFNLHYMSPRSRWVILKELAKINNFSVAKNKLDHNRQIQLSWERLKTAASAKVLQPCIHKYLYSHVVRGSSGMFLKIDPNDWHMAILLPVEDFRKHNSANLRKYSSVRAPKVWNGNY